MATGDGSIFDVPFQGDARQQPRSYGDERREPGNNPAKRRKKSDGSSDPIDAIRKAGDRTPKNRIPDSRPGFDFTGGPTDWRGAANAENRNRGRNTGQTGSRTPAQPAAVRTPDTQRVSYGSRTPAAQLVAGKLRRLGFDEGEITKFMSGLDYDTLQSPNLTYEKFRQTSMWQNEFGNVMKMRDKNEKGYLSEREILGLRDAYSQVLNDYNISGKFADKDDLDDLIGRDVSVNEFASRVKLADQVANNQDPATLKALKDYYGIGKKDVVGYFLNEKKGITMLEQQAQAAMLGGEAKRAGFDGIGKQFSERLVDIGKTQEEVRSAYQNVAETKAGWKQLAAVSGETLTNKQLVKDELNLDKKDKVGRKKRTLASQERARFGGSNGGDKQMGKSTSGDY